MLWRPRYHTVGTRPYISSLHIICTGGRSHRRAGHSSKAQSEGLGYACLQDTALYLATIHLARAFLSRLWKNFLKKWYLSWHLENKSHLSKNWGNKHLRKLKQLVLRLWGRKSLAKWPVWPKHNEQHRKRQQWGWGGSQNGVTRRALWASLRILDFKLRPKWVGKKHWGL